MRKRTINGFYKIIDRCKSCKYRGSDCGYGNCDYILITGHMRGCDPENCDKYEKGKRLRWKEDDTEKPRGWNHRNNFLFKPKESI